VGQLDEDRHKRGRWCAHDSEEVCRVSFQTKREEEDM
jgi:hypothetical protein